MGLKDRQNLNFKSFKMKQKSKLKMNIILLRSSLFLLLICVISTNFCQEKNILLSREFWKSKPNIEKIDSCINSGNDVTELNEYAFDAVCWAILEKNSNEVIKYLISKDGNDVNKITHDGRTYIFWALYKDNLTLMKYLLEKGAKTDIIDSHGYSLLNFGAVTGQTNTALYDFCIANGSNPKIEKNNDGANPLLLVAPFIEDDKLINYFLSKGIDINEKDYDGNGIFNYTAKRGNQKMMNLLIQKGVNYKNLNKINGNAMIFASYGTRSYSNKLSTYKYLDSIGIEANVTTSKGVNPLHSIVYKVKDKRIINYFIEKGVNINQVNTKGFNVLMNSCYSNDTSVISHLINYTENINHKNNEGKSALTIAVSSNTFEAIELLVNNGAEVNILDKNGNNLMYYLIKYARPSNMDLTYKKMSFLIQQGLVRNKTQQKGNTLYHIIVDKNNIELFEKINSFDININKANDDGLTALHTAAMKGENTKILEKLISLGADQNLKTPFGETPFDLAKENELLQKSKSSIEFLKPTNE